MTKNVNHIQHIKSNVVVEGKPKLPQSSALVEGELAINYAENVETISLKNSNDDIVTFSSDNYYTKQKLGSGFTGENSATTVTEALENLQVGEEVEVTSGDTPTGDTIEIWIDESVDPLTVDAYTKAEVNALVNEKQDIIDDQAPIGNGVGVCSTSAETLAKEVVLADYVLVKNGFVSVTFENDVPSGSTLNVNNQGAKAIYHKGAPIEDDVISSGDTVLFGYDGTHYVVSSLGGGNNSSEGTASYTPTLPSTPTESTLTYEKDGKTYNFEIGQFARVADDAMVSGYRFYQLYDIKNNNTTAVWSEFATRLDPTYTAPTPKSLTYNTNVQYLVNAGSTSDGVIKYSYDGTTWSTDIPTGQSAGNYTTYWKLSADGIHSDVLPTSLSTTIAKASRTLSFTQSSAKVFIDDTATFIATPSAGSGDGGVTYTSSNTNVATFNGNVLSGVSVGSTTVTATIAEGANYLSAATSMTVTISERNVVDLGLSVKWCTHNVGAEYEYQNGSYFSWANTTAHSKGSGYDFSQATYNSTTGNSLQTNIGATSGYDMARANMGSPWRLPTKEEFQELYDNCTWTWTTSNGVNGYRVTSKVAGYTSNSIFIPAVGYYNGTTLNAEGSGGYYWSSSFFSATNAYYLSFLSSNVYPQGSNSRYYGFSVRAVQ